MSAEELKKVEDEMLALERLHAGYFVMHDYVDDKGKRIDYKYSKTSLFCLTD